jgi:hypothetical protein
MVSESINNLKGGIIMKTSQREAVYTATVNVLGENDVHFEDGMSIDSVMTDAIRASVHEIVCEGFSSGTVEFKDTPENAEKLANPAKLSSYVSGLISNWYRKDKRFNGNTTYTPKNPGSRAGQGDPQLKALRALSKQFQGVDQAKFDLITAQIESRVAAIQSEKAKHTIVDYSAIPADLLAELGLSNE